MANRGSRGDDELYLARPNNGGDSPTIEPLCINKPVSPQPTSAQSQQKYNYPPPKQASKHSFPLPPGASSSAAPLPYPDDEGTFQYPKPERKQYRAPYPDDDRDQRTHSPQQYQFTSPPQRTESVQSGRPAGNSRKTSYDQPPRQSPTDQRQPGLAQRRGTAPKPLPQSPGPDVPDKEGVFAKEEQRLSYIPVGQQYTGHEGLIAPQPTKLDRYTSTASTSTTRASRGSPAPPETPIVGPGESDGGIETRYAAAGISGTATLNSLQGQSAAALQRMNQYQPPQLPQMPLSPAFSPAMTHQQQPTPRPWTPTELPGDMAPHGPQVLYQGPTISPPAPSVQSQQRPEHRRQGSADRIAVQPTALEQDFQRMQMSSDPPPSYSSVANNQTAQGYPNEKAGTPGHTGLPSQQSATTVAAAVPLPQTPAPTGKVDPYARPLASPGLHAGHPAFANEPLRDPDQTPVQQFASAQPFNQGTLGPASPPPLPEGWIAHLDQNSGQYYYIHLATQATQWEFPKGPTPLNDTAPLSPTGTLVGGSMLNPGIMSPAFSQFGGKHGIHSPGLFPPQTPGYAESIMSSMSTATTTGFSGPPPSAGVDMFKIQPTNGVYFGPYLKYINMDLERGIWLGSIMLVSDAQPPTIHIHQSTDLSPNPRQLDGKAIYTHQRWVFYRYDIDLQMEDGPSVRWTYAITSHLGCTRYEFLVAGRHETNWRFLAHSGNDFALGTNATERSRLGGVGFMWKDILAKNVECGGFHVQLGLGNQIYADRLWKEVPSLKQWLTLPGKEARRNAQWTASHEESVGHAYFHYYTSHFDQSFLREAFAQIPHVCQIGDHDVFDGFGSYPEHMQSSHMFKNIGRIGIEVYLLFQHHTTLELLRNVSDDVDLFTITGTGWHFVKYLGPAMVVVGPDVRSERTRNQVMAGPTYQGLFPKVACLPPSVQHCVWMIGVPLLYPRLDTMESLTHTIATGKKAVNSTYNLLGKVTSSVAGVVGGKEIVSSGFSSVKRAVGKGGLMGGVLNSFGEVDIGEGLVDMWTHESKDLERTYLIRTLQSIAQQKGVRMTFLSGGMSPYPLSPIPIPVMLPHPPLTYMG